MKFVRAIWKLLVGIKDALVLLFMLLFFGALYARAVGAAGAGEGRRARPQPQGQRGRAAGARRMVRRRRRASSAISPSRPRRRARQGEQTTSRSKRSRSTSTASAAAAQTAIGDLADAVRRVRAPGKPVVAYGVGYTDDSYALASAASEIWLNPLGAVLITGPGRIEPLFQGPARQARRDRERLSRRYLQVGGRAVHPQRHVARGEAELHGARPGDARNLAAGVQQARPKANVDLFLTDMNGAVAAAGGDMAKAALQAGLVDRVGDRRAFEARLAELGGKAPGAAPASAGSSSASYVADKVDRKPTGPIGVVTIAGMIVDGKAGPGTAGGDTIAKEIEDGVRNKGIKALVVRVDSPGGSVLASERIRQALLEAKAQQHPGRRVDGQRRGIRRLLGLDPGQFHFRRALDHHRLDRRVRRAAELPGDAAEARRWRGRREDHAAVGRARPAKGPSPEANQLIQTGVEAMYARFLNIVAASRHKTPQQVDQIAQGRVWDGGTARQIGLVDGFGGMSDAIAKAAQLAKLGDERGVRYLEPPHSFRDQLIADAFAERDDDTAAAGRRLRDAAPRSRSSSSRAISRSAVDPGRPSIQARCLECPPAGAPART